MRKLLLVGALLVGCSAQDPNADVQYLQQRKGGGGQFQYRGTENLSRFFNNTQGSSNFAGSVTSRVGICEVEVPTATLARDRTNIPAGNGSRPDLSRIESCCKGYLRNIHNSRICDPVCSNGCVNGLCTAPETCTCYPEHVRNLAGFCMATCPIGCQNGHCGGNSGRECLCKEGFTLDRGGRFCVPRCRENCGGIGNCTAPNTCSCNPGYHSTPEGSCKSGIAPPTALSCTKCIGGDCINGVCQCRTGYILYKGECYPLCNPPCVPDTWCAAPNTCSSSPRPAPHQQNNTNQNPQPNQIHTLDHGRNASHPQNSTTLVNYPYPPNSQNLNGQNSNNQYPSPYPQYPYGQPNQYPQPGQTYPNQPSNSNQGHYPQPGQQHLYPILPQNQYPANPNQPNNINRNDGQVYYQNSLNRLDNNTFNLQQGTQGYTQGRGQFSYQGQSNEGQYSSQGQTTAQVFHQNPYNPLENTTFNLQQGAQGTHGQGQFNSQGQRNEGQYSSQGQTTGQVFHQNPYNPLENTTFNLQQGAQGTHGQGQFNSQGQRNEGQYSSQGQQGLGVIGLVNNPNGFNSTSYQAVYGVSQVQGQGAPQGQHRGDIDSTQGQNNQQQSTGQVYSQNSYNPLANVTYNLQQGSQGQTHGQGQYSSQWQHNADSQYTSQGQFGQGQYVYGQERNPQGQANVNGQAFEPQGQEQTLNWPDRGTQCTQPCLNGNCIGPNSCECYPGYKHDQSDLTGARCLPHCPGGCQNGYCSAPNTCECRTGYFRDFGVKGRFSCVLRERRSIEELVYKIPVNA